MINDIPRITSFKELLNEIAWSWSYPNHEFIKHSDPEGFTLNKLYITKDRVSYKTDNWILDDGIYEELEAFYEFLQTVERRSNEDDVI